MELLIWSVMNPIMPGVCSRIPRILQHSKFLLIAAVFCIGLQAHGQDGASDNSVSATVVAGRRAAPVAPDESEIAIRGLGSFGHYHIFANSWWSYLDLAGIEYNRHSWGYKLGARMDYSAEFDPVVLLRQPSKTDIWGNPLSKDHTLVYGMGIAPIGLRMTWRSRKNLRPYYVMRGGVDVFTKKAVSQYASYLNFSLEMGVGAQFRVSPGWDARVGFSDYHFSDAFMTPSNPGLDSMSYTAGMVYHLHGRTR